MSVPSWVYGIALSFGGCTVSNFGVNMQKMAHTQVIASNTGESYAKHPIWISGMALVIIGSVCDLISFGFAPMSLLAPLGAMTLVVNMFVAPCFLNESLSRRDVIWTLVIVVGTVVCICFGSKEEGSYSIGQLLDLYNRAPFIIFAVLLCLTMISIYYLIKQSAQREAKLLHTAWDTKFQAFAYPAVAGTFGGLSVLFSKSSAEIVKETVRGYNQFVHVFTYILLFLAFLCLYLQMKLLNDGLTKADALFVVPVYQVFWVVNNVIAGMIYFEDYLTLTWTEMFFFIMGVIVTLLGVYFLTQRSPPAATSSGPTQLSSLPNSTTPSRSSSLTPKDRLSARIRGSSFLLGFHVSVDDTTSIEQPFIVPAFGMLPIAYLPQEQFSLINGM